jgi:ribosomal protein S18 acetylase RimI-like enzyme
MYPVMTPVAPRTVAIRRAEPGDEWAIRRLFGELHTFNASLDARFALADGWERVVSEHLAQERMSQRSVTFLAWDGDNPIGMAMMGTHTDSPLFRHRSWAELSALHVIPAARGRGVADLLLAAGTVWAQECGYAEVRLYVTASNERARRFYDRAGFRPIQEIWTADLNAVEVDRAA